MKTIRVSDSKPAQIVMWVVDDHVDDLVVKKPIWDCLTAFVTSRSTGRAVRAAACSARFESSADLGLRSALRWKYVISAESGAIDCFSSAQRHIDFVIYGFSDWAPLEAFLAGRITGPKDDPIWPHLVFTDLYKGIRTVPKGGDDIRKLPGYGFATSCIDLRIPCIAYTSEPRAFDTHSYLFHNRPLYYCPRSGFIGDGYVLQTLRHELWPKLSRNVWLPEFKLTLRGHKNPGDDTFNVIFKLRSDVFSHTPAMHGTSYAYLYIWAYASILTQLKGWDSELEGWDYTRCGERSCMAVCRPTDSSIQHLPLMGKLFEKSAWSQKTNIFYYEGDDLRNRNADILNSNIIHLDAPTSSAKLPSMWGGDHILNNLKLFLREILPPSGLAWLYNYSS